MIISNFLSVTISNTIACGRHCKNRERFGREEGRKISFYIFLYIDSKYENKHI